MNPLLLILAWPAPREPISALDPVRDGETELSAGYTASVIQGLPYANDIATGRPWTLGVSHGVGELELRGTLAQNIDYPMLGVSLGWRPSLGWEWTPVLELGYSVSGGARAPQGWGGEIYGRRSEEAYWTHTPSARLRLVYELRSDLQIPLAVRVSETLRLDPSVLGTGLVELTSGLIWETSSCLQVGVGGSIQVATSGPIGPEALLLGHGSLSCTFGGS